MGAKILFALVSTAIALGQSAPPVKVEQRKFEYTRGAAKLGVGDSNMALIGSDIDKKQRKENAQREKAWQGIGLEEGMWVFRIEKLEPKPWKKEDYGKFYKGDCYIILNVSKSASGDSLNRNIYFWLGAESTQDEQGGAAIKTVELDDFFGGTPIQHREVQGWESREFSSLFPQGITLMEGGIDSAFDPADPVNYKKVLFTCTSMYEEFVVHPVTRMQHVRFVI